jgi:ribosomal protein S18 acetylase RimI-like enzyme
MRRRAVHEMQLNIRRFTEPADLEGIARLVSSVVVECYGDLVPDYSFDAGENWPASWIAESDDKVVGVLLTSEDCVDDLWIARPYRRQGIGARLLSIGEDEISERGYDVGRLRVVGVNTLAIKFYARHGWEKTYRRHAIYQFEMVEFRKRLVLEAQPHIRDR